MISLSLFLTVAPIGFHFNLSVAPHGLYLNCQSLASSHSCTTSFYKHCSLQARWGGKDVALSINGGSAIIVEMLYHHHQKNNINNNNNNQKLYSSHSESSSLITTTSPHGGKKQQQSEGEEVRRRPTRIPLKRRDLVRKRLTFEDKQSSPSQSYENWFLKYNRHLLPLFLSQKM